MAEREREREKERETDRQTETERQTGHKAQDNCAEPSGRVNDVSTNTAKIVQLLQDVDPQCCRLFLKYCWVHHNTAVSQLVLHSAVKPLKYRALLCKHRHARRGRERADDAKAAKQRATFGYVCNMHVGCHN